MPKVSKEGKIPTKILRKASSVNPPIRRSAATQFEELRRNPGLKVVGDLVKLTRLTINVLEINDITTIYNRIDTTHYS